MKRWAGVLLPVTAATFMTTFDGAAVQLALPALRHDFGADIDSVHWVMTAFLLVSSSTLLQAGRSGDVLGRERVWRFGVLVFVVSSAVAVFMPGLWWLVGARAGQGFGAALATANSAAILVEAFPDERGKMLGLGNIAIALGLVVGPPIGALLTNAVSWRLIFIVALPVGLVSWFVARKTLPESERRRAPLGWSSGVLSMIGLGGVLVAGSFGERWGWGSVVTLVLFGVGALAIVAFFVVQLRSKSPLLERRFVATRMFVSGLLAVFFGFAALFTVTISMPFFLLLAQHRGTIATGLLVGVVPVALSIVAPIAGAATDKVGSRWICTGGLALVTFALLLIASGGQYASTRRIIVALALIGAGLGGFEAPNDVDVLGTLPPDRLSAGTALLNAVRDVGMTLGTAAGGTLLSIGIHVASGSQAHKAAHGTGLALLAGAGCAALGTIGAVIRPGGPPKRTS